MRCRDVRRMVIMEGSRPYRGRVQGDDGSPHSAELARHLENCEACRESAEAYGGTAAIIRLALQSLPLDPDFTAKVMKRIRGD